MTQGTLHIENLSLDFKGEVLFSDLNLILPPKKWIGLIGPSGVGKTSLLRLIAGIKDPKENVVGRIYVDNEYPLSQQVAYMAQTDLLMPWLTVLENVMLGNKLRRIKTIQKDKAEHLLLKVGLLSAKHLYPHQLSGGMRQRASLVRTLLEDKPIILMDEPFSAVDTITRYKLQELAATLLQNKTVLFITHDPMEALRLADEIYLMQGKPAELKAIATLTSKTPRALNDNKVIELQTVLITELTKAASL